MNVGIILAAGDGTRMKAEGKNKTALVVNNKPLVAYGVELLQPFVDTIVVVVGSHADSVKQVLQGYDNLVFVEQTQRLGTGHALQVAHRAIASWSEKIDTVLVGYGDHMMLYRPETIATLIKLSQDVGVGGVLVSTEYAKPNKLAWGRVIRDRQGNLEKIVEQKDASEAIRNITEINTGLYSFKQEPLSQVIDKLEPSKASGEYYLTDIPELLVASGYRVRVHRVDFQEVGVGANTPEQLSTSSLLLSYV